MRTCLLLTCSQCLPSEPGHGPGSVASSHSSSTSSNRPPAMTGQTPPTRDVKVRRSTSLNVRRSLDTNLAAVGDQDLQKDLEDYFKRFGSLQKYRVRQ